MDDKKLEKKLEKAKIDGGKTPREKTNARAERHQRVTDGFPLEGHGSKTEGFRYHNEQKGVHQPAKQSYGQKHGTSEAGLYTRAARTKPGEARPSVLSNVEGYRNISRGMHEQKLNELKSMPKPNLGKDDATEDDLSMSVKGKSYKQLKEEMEKANTGHETGVHVHTGVGEITHDAEKRGTSYKAGANLGGVSSAGESLRNGRKEFAVSQHKEVLNEMKTMPKPNLPKSETGLNGKSLNQLKKEEMEKGLGKDLMVGASMAAALAAAGTAHKEQVEHGTSVTQIAEHSGESSMEPANLEGLSEAHDKLMGKKLNKEPISVIGKSYNQLKELEKVVSTNLAPAQPAKNVKPMQPPKMEKPLQAKNASHTLPGAPDTNAFRFKKSETVLKAEKIVDELQKSKKTERFEIHHIDKSKSTFEIPRNSDSMHVHAFDHFKKVSKPGDTLTGKTTGVLAIHHPDHGHLVRPGSWLEHELNKK